MREVLFYKNLASLKSLPYYNKIQNLPVISDSSELALKLKELGLFTERSTSINHIIRDLFPHWRNDEAKFTQLLLTKNIIRRVETECGNNNHLFYEGCRKNAFEIISAIRTFVEAQMFSKDLPNLSDPAASLMAEVWGELEKSDDLIIEFYKRSKDLEDENVFKKCLTSSFGTSDFTTVIMHCFFFLTPMQEYVVRLFEKHGYNIIMLGACDQQHSEANEVWDFTYRPEFNYEPKSKWIYDNSENYSPFADIIEGKHCKLKSNITLNEYSSIISFERDISKYDSTGWQIVSPDSKKSNEILRDFYPDRYPVRSLLAYPIGQFIFSIHSMWSEELNTIVLDADILRTCFSSGWIDIDGHDSREYLSDLESILPYFENCITADQWDLRLDELADVLNNAVYIMDSHHEGSCRRWENLMGNPLRIFSMFSVEPDRLDAVTILIRNLVNMARDLFGSGNEIDVNSHMRKLESYLKKDHPENSHVAEENSIMKKVVDRISTFDKRGLKCYPSDIFDAIMLYLDDNIGADEDSIDDFVGPLYVAEPESLCKTGKVHICLCDDERMPGCGKYVWPLNESIVEEIYRHVIKENQSTLMTQMILTVSGRPLYRRYLMALILRNNEVAVSWISEMDGKKVRSSPYVEILSQEFGIKINGIHMCGIGTGNIEGYTLPFVSRSVESVIPEVSIDGALCIYRYIYGYVLKERPVFSDLFMQQFAVTELIRAISRSSGIPVNEVKKNVLVLFENYLDIQKIQMSDFAGSSGNEDTDSYLADRTRYTETDMTYTNQRLRMEFASPGGAVLDKAISLYLHNDPNHNNLHPGSDVCKYCPHKSYCVHFEKGDE